MTVREIERSAAYLSRCLENFRSGILPLDRNNANEEGYLRLVEIAETYNREGQLKRFLEYLKEGQFYVDLWTAHLILRCFGPSLEVEQAFVAVIRKYSSAAGNAEVAGHAVRWLKEYGSGNSRIG